MTTGKTIAIILVVCAGIGILLIGACAGLLYYGYAHFKNADSQVSQRIDALFVSIENGTFPATYDTETTQELRSIATREQYVSIGNLIKTRLGRLKTKTLQTFNAKHFNSVSCIEVSYKATFEKGDGTITATMKKEDGKWKFMGFNVNSPVFLQGLTSVVCPKCGMLHSSSDQFCPSCGAKTDEEEKPAEQSEEPARTP